ncbi:RNA polymerase sigma factor [Pinibacter aurantiacus]|uniref:Sigma-70 family RNA polymerase sigma factor n=1 Tax=Pinibacter aurantiacus TaxID=2851599 RepID=A0A9E2W8B2_9BACT|nr:sigma-70 family RNA polymerase sigma factor [Pinibacter aurantiacus]MBV4358261.1 sigma-70 family RNA polymerase sigma factor [Pinibacter aurantiacus]
MLKYSNDTLVALWNDFRNGSSTAFSSIIKWYYKDLFRYGCKFTQDEHLVKDCIQNVFLSLWKNHATIGETEHVKFYLLTCLRRDIAKELKKGKTEISYDNFSSESFFDLGLNAENRLVDREKSVELAKKIKETLKSLSKRQQEIIYLRFYMNADADKIAEIMEINHQSVYNLLHDALKKLKTVSEKFIICLMFLLTISGL